MTKCTFCTAAVLASAACFATPVSREYVDLQISNTVVDVDKKISAAELEASTRANDLWAEDKSQAIDGLGDIYETSWQEAGCWVRSVITQPYNILQWYTNGVQTASGFQWKSVNGQAVTYNADDGSVSVAGQWYGNVLPGLDPLAGDDLGSVTNAQAGVSNIVKFIVRGYSKKYPAKTRLTVDSQLASKTVTGLKHDGRQDFDVGQVSLPDYAKDYNAKFATLNSKLTVDDMYGWSAGYSPTSIVGRIHQLELGGTNITKYLNRTDIAEYDDETLVKSSIVGNVLELERNKHLLWSKDGMYAHNATGELFKASAPGVPYDKFATTNEFRKALGYYTTAEQLQADYYDKGQVDTLIENTVEQKRVTYLYDDTNTPTQVMDSLGRLFRYVGGAPEAEPYDMLALKSYADSQLAGAVNYMTNAMPHIYVGIDDAEPLRFSPLYSVYGSVLVPASAPRWASLTDGKGISIPAKTAIHPAVTVAFSAQSVSAPSAANTVNWLLASSNCESAPSVGIARTNGSVRVVIRYPYDEVFALTNGLLSNGPISFKLDVLKGAGFATLAVSNMSNGASQEMKSSVKQRPNAPDDSLLMSRFSVDLDSVGVAYDSGELNALLGQYASAYRSVEAVYVEKQLEDELGVVVGPATTDRYGVVKPDGVSVRIEDGKLVADTGGTTMEQVIALIGAEPMAEKWPSPSAGSLAAEVVSLRQQVAADYIVITNLTRQYELLYDAVTNSAAKIQGALED